MPTAAPVHDSGGIERAIGDFANKPDGGLLVLPDATTNLHRELIIALAARHRMPAVYGFRHIAEEGGLISYGVDIVELFRRSATYVDRILKGAKPADLAVLVRTLARRSATVPFAAGLIRRACGRGAARCRDQLLWV